MTTRITPDATSARRQIDLAVGVLIGFHGCSADQAFDALAQHSLLYSVGLLPTARAVLDTAQGRPSGDSVSALFDRTVAAA